MRSFDPVESPSSFCASWLIGKVFDRLSWSNFDGPSVSFCKRSRKASIPSGSCSSFGGGSGGGGGIAANSPVPGFGREGNPELPFEKTEPRDALEAVDILEFPRMPLLLELPCVFVRL